MSDHITEFPPDLCPVCHEDIDYECGCQPREFLEYIEKLRIEETRQQRAADFNAGWMAAISRPTSSLRDEREAYFVNERNEAQQRKR